MECGGIIPPNDQYMRIVYKQDERTYSESYHKRCKLPTECATDGCNNPVVVIIHKVPFCGPCGVNYLTPMQRMTRSSDYYVETVPIPVRDPQLFSN